MMNSTNSTNSLYNYLVGDAIGGATPLENLEGTAEHLYGTPAGVATPFTPILVAINALNQSVDISTEILQGILIPILDDTLHKLNQHHTSDTIKEIFNKSGYTGWTANDTELKAKSLKQIIIDIELTIGRAGPGVGVVPAAALAAGAYPGANDVDNNAKLISPHGASYVYSSKPIVEPVATGVAAHAKLQTYFRITKNPYRYNSCC